MKNDRQSMILEIISQENIETQEQLLVRLQERGITSTQATIFRESITSIDSAQNIVVIKTMPGLASAACAALDDMGVAYMVGSLAGDDTAFLVMRDTESAASFCEEIKEML